MLLETTSRRVELADEGQERLAAHERRGQRTKVPASGWRRGAQWQLFVFMLIVIYGVMAWPCLLPFR